MRISQLEALAAGGGRIALWGWGREGRAAYAALRAARDSGSGIRDSAGVPLTVFCAEDEAREVLGLGDPSLAVETVASREHLARFDVVIKSPGISPYRAEAMAAAAQGTRFIGGTTLWFAGRAAAGEIAARTVCVTGTKGKSTTTALLAHLLRAHGLRTALAGNIGLPLLELLDAQADAWAIELSSYQTGDVAAGGVRPDVAVVTNIFPEHLDWHGSEAQYVEDKLALVTRARPRIAVLNADDPRLASLALPGSEIRWFGTPDGWHLRGDVLHRGRGTLVRDEIDLQVVLQGDLSHRQVRRGAQGAERAGDLARIRLDVSDQFPGGLRRHARVHDNRQRSRRRQRNCPEFPRIRCLPVEGRCDDEASGVIEDGGAIRRRLHDFAGRDVAAGARLVLDDDGLAERFAHVLRQQAGNDVRWPPGREADDEPHGPGAESLREQGLRQNRGGENGHALNEGTSLHLSFS